MEPRNLDRPTVRDLGEFGLIDRISRPAGNRTGGVVLGIGDDTAALRITPGRLLLATCDAQVEGRHFIRANSTPDLIGRRTLAVNISDIAAMGGVPRYALVSLGLPPETLVSFVDGLYDGLYAEAAEFGMDIVGGNVASTAGAIFIDITLLGEVEPGGLLTRGGAQPGDAIIVTGSPGESAAGLALLLGSSLTVPAEVAERLKTVHRLPTPRIAAGRAAGATGFVHAAADISDGLAADLGHIMERSRVGAVLRAESLPLSDAVRLVAEAAGRDPLNFVLHGGEDYELVMTVDPAGVEDVLAAISGVGVGATIIGEVLTEASGLLLEQAGERASLPKTGFRHF